MATYKIKISIIIVQAVLYTDSALFENIDPVRFCSN